MLKNYSCMKYDGRAGLLHQKGLQNPIKEKKLQGGQAKINKIKLVAMNSNKQSLIKYQSL